MLARIERYLYALIAMLALWAVVVAVTPATAQAQQTAPSKDTNESIVVRPGDSLWSISSEWLGPNATPQQVAIGVERIYALNKNRIGGDPNLILAGQRLSLPPMSEPSRAEAPTGAAPTREATKTAEPSTREPNPQKASRTPGDTEAKPVGPPEMPPQQAAPEVGSPTATDAPSPVESFVSTARSLLSSATSTVVGFFPQDNQPEGRKILGLGIIALTLLVAGLITWRMPLKRNVGGFEAWGIPTGYVGHYTPITNPDSGSIGGGEAPAVENDLNGGAAGMIVAARRRRERALREQERGSRESPHSGLATGAHDPQVTRHLRRARSSTLGRSSARRPQRLRRSLSSKRGRL